MGGGSAREFWLEPGGEEGRRRAARAARPEIQRDGDGVESKGPGNGMVRQSRGVRGATAPRDKGAAGDAVRSGQSDAEKV